MAARRASMDLIKWRESYGTGVLSMDNQHRKIIDLINELYKHIRNEETSSSVEDVLSAMIKYAEEHLQEEENLLKTNDFSDYDEHMSKHQSYRERLSSLMAESKTDPEAAVKSTYAFLRQWWMGHIVDEDKKYGEFLKGKGVA
jgi:hemerythrin